MSEFIQLLLAGILSGSVISSILGLILYRRTTSMAADIKNEYAKGMTVFQSSRLWKEQSVSQLLGPLYLQFDRTARAFKNWRSQNLYLEAMVIKDGNLKIRNLLLDHSHLIPPDLLEDAGDLVEHYDRWLEEFDRLRDSENPDLDAPFVFAGPKGYPFPKKAEQAFLQEYHRLWAELYREEESS